MDDGKINISWDDLKTRRVENRLREQQAVAPTALLATERRAPPEATPTKASLWHNTAFITTAFGLLGGFLAWLARFGFVMILPWFAPHVLHYNPNASRDAEQSIADIHSIEAAHDIGRTTAQQAAIAIQQVQFSSRDNPYFTVSTDTKLSDAQRHRQIAPSKSWMTATSSSSRSSITACAAC